MGNNTSRKGTGITPEFTSGHTAGSAQTGGQPLPILRHVDSRPAAMKGFTQRYEKPKDTRLLPRAPERTNADLLESRKRGNRIAAARFPGYWAK